MITKYLIIVVGIVCLSAGSAGTLYITKATKPVIEIKTEKVVAPTCPPCNGIDFDKIKSKALTIQNHQHLTVNADSTFEVTLRKVIQEEISKVRIAKCK